MPALRAGIFSVLGGSTSHLLPEGFGEITHILKTAADGNIRYFQPGFCQLFGRLPDAVLLQILNWCSTDGFAETSQTFALADRGSGSDGSGGEFAALAPHERLTDLAVVPREKPHTGAAAREQPRDSPVIER